MLSRERKSCDIQNRQSQGMAGTHLLQFSSFLARRKQPVRVLLIKEALLAINHMHIHGKGKTPYTTTVSPVSSWSWRAQTASRWVWHRGCDEKDTDHCLKTTEKGKFSQGRNESKQHHSKSTSKSTPSRSPLAHCLFEHTLCEFVFSLRLVFI